MVKVILYHVKDDGRGKAHYDIPEVNRVYDTKTYTCTVDAKGISIEGLAVKDAERIEFDKVEKFSPKSYKGRKSFEVTYTSKKGEVYSINFGLAK